MKLPSFISRSGIRKRVMILALLPVTIITLVLSGYMIVSRLNDERANLFENSASLLSYLAAGAEFGMFANNSDALSSLARAAGQRSEISDIIFINQLGETVFRSGDQSQAPFSFEPPQQADVPVQGESPRTLGKLWMFQAPILVSGVAVDDFSETDTAAQEAEPLGWVVMLVNNEDMKRRQRSILIRGLLITIAGLSLTIWMALVIGRSITQPIQAIISTIDKLRREQLDARVQVSSSGEIGELEKGINSLAKRVQRTRIRLQDEIDEATANLRFALENLEKKNRALDAEKQRAEQANQAKDQFLARMSHELRTPLTSVIGFVQLLQKTRLDSEQKEYSTIVSRTSSLLLRLIDDILDFSKLQSDAIRIEKIPFSLEECIEDSLEMQAATAAEKGIGLHFIVDPAFPDRVLGDPTRMRQVIANLVGNAVKFTASGEVSIKLRCTTHSDTAAVTLTVRDSGVGIDQEKLSTLFKPFTQADTSITRRFGGSGLGLVITRRLVELMGGEIALHSTPGRGTEVQLQLSFDRCEQPAAAIDLGQSGTLVFERNPTAMRSLISYLRKWHNAPVTVDSQQQLIDTLKRQGDELELLIIGLPASCRTALYLKHLLRSVRRYFAGRILVVTGQHCDADPAEDGSESTRITVIHQPLTGRKLLQGLQQSTVANGSVSLASRSVPQPSAPQQSGSLQDLRLLVAEDNNFNRLLIQKILEQAGAVAVMVGDGRQAVAEAARVRFDCVLMDVHMPIMDGIEASNLIRQLPAPYSQVPILALTANVIANEEKALLAAGVETTLFKPVNEQSIISHVQRAAKVSQPTEFRQPATERPRLVDYGISDKDLCQELNGQISAIRQAFADRNRPRMRDHSHQLMGLAGLLDLVELEAATMAFNQTVKNAGSRAIWQALWRLQRVIAAVEV